MNDVLAKVFRVKPGVEDYDPFVIVGGEEGENIVPSKYFQVVYNTPVDPSAGAIKLAEFALKTLMSLPVTNSYDRWVSTGDIFTISDKAWMFVASKFKTHIHDINKYEIIPAWPNIGIVPVIIDPKFYDIR